MKKNKVIIGSFYLANYASGYGVYIDNDLAVFTKGKYIYIDGFEITIFNCNFEYEKDYLNFMIENLVLTLRTNPSYDTFLLLLPYNVYESVEVIREIEMRLIINQIEDTTEIYESQFYDFSFQNFEVIFKNDSMTLEPISDNKKGLLVERLNLKIYYKN